MTSHYRNPVVIGAGPTGLSASWKLTELGIDVRLLEKTEKIGGLAQTFRHGDYLFDIGPHIFHTFHAEILSLVKEILGNDLLRYYPKTKIFYKNRFVQYPLSGMKVFTVLPLMMVAPALISFLLARWKLYLSHPREDGSFESWIKSRFGKKLYDVYFAPYAQKVWMMKAAEISKYIAEQKVPELKISDYVRRLFNRPPKKIHGEDASRMEVFYPRKGIGQLTNWLYDKVIEKGGKVDFNVDIHSINGKNSRIESITYRQDDELVTRGTDFVFSTMPLNDLIEILKIKVPRDVREAAEHLGYVSAVLFYLKVNKRKLIDSSWVYFSSPDVWFNRVFDVGAFCEECVPAGKTAYCIEFTCNRGDKIWHAGADELFDHVMQVFERNSIMSRADVEGYTIKKVEHAYPRFKIGFDERVRIILDFLSTIENVFTIGRQGLFCYANVDDALYMGIRAVEMMNLRGDEKLETQRFLLKLDSE